MSKITNTTEFTDFCNLIEKVVDWAKERNLINGSTPEKQGLKLMSEYGELCDSIAKGNLDGIKDGIGDVMVVSIIIATQHGENDIDSNLSLDCKYDEEIYLSLAEDIICLICNIDSVSSCIYELFTNLNSIAVNFGMTLKECLEHAYNEIKDRKGVMYQGVFVKESDERYSSILKELNGE